MSDERVFARAVCPNCFAALWDIQQKDVAREELACFNCGWVRITIGVYRGAPWMCAYRTKHALDEIRSYWGDPATGRKSRKYWGEQGDTLV